jgi:hypothetical protein
MAEGLTRKYFEEILEATGVAKRGVERLKEIKRMPEDELKGFSKDLRSRVVSHYEKNIRQVVESLLEYKKQPKAFYFGGHAPLDYAGKKAPVDWFIRKAALYYGKVVIKDPLEETLLIKDPLERTAGDKYLITEGLRDVIIYDLASLKILWPWAEAGIIEILPDIRGWTELGETISKLADEDYDDEEWASTKGALKHEDFGLEEDALIQAYEAVIQTIIPQKIIDGYGGLRNCARNMLLKGISVNLALGFFGSALTDSSPTTGLRYMWRLFGIWCSKRAELLVKNRLLDEETWMRMKEEVIAGRIRHELNIERLGALMNLPPKQIIEVREDSKYSFKEFREVLAEKVREIEIEELEDEEEIKSIVSQVSWHLNNEARSIEKDLKLIRSTFGVSVALAPLSMALGLVPFSLGSLAVSLAPSIATYILGMGRQKKRSGYFLVSLKEKAEEQEILRRYGVESKWQL